MPSLEEGEFEYVPTHFQRKPEIKLPGDLAAAVDSFGIEPENKPAAPTGLGAAVSSSEPDEVREPVSLTTTIDDQVSQVKKLAKVAKIRDDSPAYFINKKLANCRKLTSTERCCVGLLNFLMKNKDGYAWVGYPQLAHWLGLKNGDCAYNLVQKVSKKGFIRDKGDYRGKHRWVVCDEWRDPKPRSRKPSVRDDDAQIPFRPEI
jgi:hypothetical protein